jgi:outer membrane protein OmpA-like peptidoglycan-associated protein
MAVHLVSYLKEQFTPGVIDQLSAELSEKPASILKVVQGVIPTLLGGLTKRVQESGGAGSIFSFLEKGDYGKTPFDVSQVTDTHQETIETATAGRDFLDHTFGEKLPRTTELIGTFSGAKPESVRVVMSLAASVLMGVLGRQEQEKGLTAHSLKTLLEGQATNFRTALPSGLDSVGSLLGFNELETPVGPPTIVQGADNFSGTVVSPNIPKSTDGDRQRENVRWLRWAAVLMGILVVALIVQKCGENENSIDGVSTDSTARVEPDAVEDTSRATKNSVIESHGQVADSTAPGALGIRDDKPTTGGTDVITQIELPGGRKLSLGEQSFNGRLARFLGSKPKNPERTFTFENLTFETGSARITAESRQNVNDLVDILKAYPNLNIRIEGHTDNTGNADTNLELSRDRASSVRTALTSAGIAGDRVTTQGYGAAHPLATNDNAEGRQRNRRIDVAVTKI